MYHVVSMYLTHFFLGQMYSLFFFIWMKNKPVITWMAVEFEFPASEEQEYSPASFWLASWTISLEVVSPDSDWTMLKHKKGHVFWVHTVQNFQKGITSSLSIRKNWRLILASFPQISLFCLSGGCEPEGLV